MAERLMPTQEPQAPLAFPFTGEPGQGAFGEMLARLLRDAPALPGASVAALRALGMAPPGDPEEAEEEEDDDLDDDLDDDEADDEDDDEDFEDDDDDEADEEPEEEAA